MKERPLKPLNDLGKKLEKQSLQRHQQRKGVDELVSWLAPVRWQYFCCFTFALARASEWKGRRILGAVFNHLESYYRTGIGMVFSGEWRFSGCGKPLVPFHYHAVVASAAPLDGAFIATTWEHMAGKRSEGAGADVRRYDPCRTGLKYILKEAYGPEDRWGCWNLDLVHPSAPFHATSFRQKRRLSRSAQQSELYRRKAAETFEAHSRAEVQLIAARARAKLRLP